MGRGGFIGNTKDKLNIYLDNCCFNRAYDDQTQLRIELETKAKLFVQNLIVERKVDFTISSILKYENNNNPFDERRFSITDFFKNATHTIKATTEVQTVAKEVRDSGLKLFDAVHVDRQSKVAVII